MFACMRGYGHGGRRTIKEGAYNVNATDHVLVLNWSHHTIPLLRQYAAARHHRADPFFNRQAWAALTSLTAVAVAAYHCAIRSLPVRASEAEQHLENK